MWWTYCRRSVFQWCFYLSKMLVNNQQYCGEIAVFHNKLPVIKYDYNFLDIQICYSDRIFDFESLPIVLDLLAPFQFESLAYYVVIILQWIRRVNFNSLTFSYIFRVFICQSHFHFYSSLIELRGDVEKNPRSKFKSNQKLFNCHWNLNSIAALNFSKIRFLIAYNSPHHFDMTCFSEKYLNSV